MQLVAPRREWRDWKDVVAGCVLAAQVSDVCRKSTCTAAVGGPVILDSVRIKTWTRDIGSRRESWSQSFSQPLGAFGRITRVLGSSEVAPCSVGSSGALGVPHT